MDGGDPVWRKIENLPDPGEVMNERMVATMCGRRIDADNPELLNLIGDKMTDFRLLGIRGDMPSIFSASDVLANTSTHGEGLSVAMLEAMSCGCVPVMTDVGDAKLVIGAAGIITEIGTSERIKNDINKALNYKDRSIPRSRIIERYNLQSMATHFLMECSSPS